MCAHPFRLAIRHGNIARCCEIAEYATRHLRMVRRFLYCHQTNARSAGRWGEESCLRNWNSFATKLNARPRGNLPTTGCAGRMESGTRCRYSSISHSPTQLRPRAFCEHSRRANPSPEALSSGNVFADFTFLALDDFHRVSNLPSKRHPATDSGTIRYAALTMLLSLWMQPLPTPKSDSEPAPGCSITLYWGRLRCSSGDAFIRSMVAIT